AVSALAPFACGAAARSRALGAASRLQAGAVEDVGHRYRFYARPLAHPDPGRARSRDASFTLGGVGDCGLGRDRRAEQRLSRAGTASMDGRVLLRPDPRLRLRQRARGPGVAAGQPARRPGELQPGRGGGPACDRSGAHAARLRPAADLALSAPRPFGGLAPDRRRRLRVALRTSFRAAAFLLIRFSGDEAAEG